MSENVQIIAVLLCLVMVFILTRYGIATRMKKAAARIIHELEEHRALSPDNAVPLDWAEPNWLKFGIRDFRPKLLKEMVAAGIVGQTVQGFFYLVPVQRID